MIDNLTLKELKEISLLFNNSQQNKGSPFEIGKSYLIRTVTMTTIGKLEKVFDNELVLSSASWIADTGRFHDALRNGIEKLSEVEPFVNDVIVGRGSIVDATVWSHDLPTKQK
jgi:hypothetical protein